MLMEMANGCRKANSTIVQQCAGKVTNNGASNQCDWCDTTEDGGKAPDIFHLLIYLYTHVYYKYYYFKWSRLWGKDPEPLTKSLKNKARRKHH
jgi:hypothetical protein